MQKTGSVGSAGVKNPPGRVRNGGSTYVAVGTCIFATALPPGGVSKLQGIRASNLPLNRIRILPPENWWSGRKGLQCVKDHLKRKELGGGLSPIALKQTTVARSGRLWIGR